MYNFKAKSGDLKSYHYHLNMDSNESKNKNKQKALTVDNT